MDGLAFTKSGEARASGVKKWQTMVVAIAATSLTSGAMAEVSESDEASVAGASSEQQSEKLPFATGEKLSYDISLLGIRAAEADLRVSGAANDGFRFRADGRTVGATDSLFGLRETATCSVDETLTPSLCRFSSEKRSGVRRRELKFDSSSGNVRERTLHEGKREEKEIHFDSGLSDVQDALSGLYLLRSKMPEAEGEVVKFRSMRKGKPINVEATFRQVESVSTPAGTFKAARMDLRIVEQQEAGATTAASVWLSTDARRLPVKMTAAAPIGTLEASLKAATGTVGRALAER